MLCSTKQKLHIALNLLHCCSVALRQHFLVLLLKIQSQVPRISLEQSTTCMGTFTPHISIVHLQNDFFLYLNRTQLSFLFVVLRIPANMKAAYYSVRLTSDFI